MLLTLGDCSSQFASPNNPHYHLYSGVSQALLLSNIQQKAL